MPVHKRHLAHYAAIFVHRRDVYARQRADGGYFPVHEPVTLTLIQRHLAGELTCGWYALESDDTVQWIMLDADQEDGLSTLQDIWQVLRNLELCAYLEGSRRGGHLWLFVQRMPARAVRTFCQLLLEHLEIEDVELYPRQDTRPPGGLGNLVRGPLGVHQLSGKRYPFLDPDTLEPVGRTLSEQCEYLTGVRFNSAFRLLLALAHVLCDQPPLKAEAEQTSTPWDEDKVQELKAAIGDVYDFIAQYVQLDAKGRGSCPFHPPDRRPSFVVSRKKGYWICFHEINSETGRHLGGDAIEFYRRLKGLSFKQAVRELAEQYGVKGLPF